MRSCLLLAALCCSCAAAQPLSFQRHIAPFPVLDADGQPYEHPFFGGLNTPRPQLVDIDADGDLDLFVQEARNRLRFYENTAQEGYAFTWRSDRWQELEIGTWFRFGDLDGDGDLDLLTQYPSGQVRYYRNTGTPAAPAFELAVAPLLATSGEPVFAEDPNVPALADIDADGDLDLFLGQADSGLIRFYRHTGTENGVPRFELVTNRWQDIVIYEENPTCGRPGEPGGGYGIMPGGRGTLHGENALTFTDADADGDLDLFWGDFFTPSLYFFRNTGTATEPQMEFVADAYPLDNPLTSSGYNVPTFGDLDGDGAEDLVIGIVGGFCSSTANLTDNLYLLENTGTPAEPDYEEQTSRLLYGVDVGRGAYPAFQDLDGDGDLDLLVGSAYNPRPDGPRRASLFRFENTGSPTSPAFRLVDDDFLALDVDFANHYAPAFGDLDGDGQPDLLVGTFNGRFTYYRRTGPGSFELVTEALLGSDGSALDVGSTSTPTLGDLDGDGDLDLIAGEFNGNLNFYRNTGTASEPRFELVDADFLGVDTDRYSAPHLVDVDGDGDLDLFVGTETDDVLFFRNTGSATSYQFELETLNLQAPVVAAPAAADLDGDGDLDLLLGTSAGGLAYYSGGEATSAEPPGAGEGLGLSRFPNPFRDTVRFQITGVAADPGAPLTLTVFDLLGRELRQWVLGAGEMPLAVTWDGTTAAGRLVAAGVYVARLTAGPDLLATASLTRLR